MDGNIYQRRGLIRRENREPSKARRIYKGHSVFSSFWGLVLYRRERDLGGSEEVLQDYKGHSLLTSKESGSSLP